MTMSNVISTAKNLQKPIKGPGLTNPGVVILQFLLILLVETIEYSFSKVGVLTGIAIILALVGGFYLGRTGTAFATVVNPPISFFISTIILIATVGGAGLRVTRFGLDLVTSLGAGAPYLALTTICGWGYYFWNKRSLSSGA
jgi:hypothetical protein